MFCLHIFVRVFSFLCLFYILFLKFLSFFIKNMPSICDICGKSFTRADNLRTHVRGVHEDPHYRCVCGKEYGHRPNLSKHRKSCAMFLGGVAPACLVSVDRPAGVEGDGAVAAVPHSVVLVPAKVAEVVGSVSIRRAESSADSVDQEQPGSSEDIVGADEVAVQPVADEGAVEIVPNLQEIPLPPQVLDFSLLTF